MLVRTDMSLEVTIMTVRSLFEKQVFLRLTEDGSAFICTTKWPVFSKTRRIGVDEPARAHRVREAGSMSPDAPMLRRQD